MGTIIGTNIAYAEANGRAAASAALKAAKSLIGAETAYAAASGLDRTDIPCAETFDAETALTWAPEDSEPVTETHLFEATLANVMQKSAKDVLDWLVDAVGVSRTSAVFADGSPSVRLTNAHDILLGSADSRKIPEDWDGITLVLEWDAAPMASSTKG